MSAVVTPIAERINASITDRPIESLDADLLSVEHYAKALKEFIVDSNTPLTIGMQGEWGTGKTSLMHLVKELLNNDDVVTAWVNTWEYSLFKSANETTPAVLKGLLEKLVQSCKERGHWKSAEDFDAMKEKAIKGMKIIGAFAARVAVHKATGESVEMDFSGPGSLVSEVAELKQQIQDLINTVVSSNKNPLKKVVFFVDDLDRIEPADAVEVLESLKNIFDIENCVFILAIDYDVVIKGLEKKFGKKTDANEREFRSFFDKIIQVPFSMPVGTYGIDNLLDTKLRELGVSIPEKFKERFLDILGLTVGYNPRSVKRFINTYSLLKRIKHIKNSDDASDPVAEFTLFSLIGIQIAYPKIFRQLNKELNYLGWDAGFAMKIGLDLDEAEEELSRVGDHELLDEPWEMVVWAYCQSDAYLKARAFNILKALNVIRYTLKKENLPERLEAAMEFASMTSVDDDLESKAREVGVRDTTKYRFNGQVYNKARLVLAVVQAFVETKGTDLTLEQLREAFPDSLQGSYGVIDDLKAVEEKYAGRSKKRHYLGPDEQLQLADSVAVVCNQWGITNINNFIDQARKCDLAIVPA